MNTLSATNVAGIVRNLSSHSDAARRRMRETEGLLDSLCDIVKFMAINLDDYDINGDSDHKTDKAIRR